MIVQSGEIDRRAIVRAVLLFAFMFCLQLGHLTEHIAKLLRGEGLLGPAGDTEPWHFTFNAAIAVLAIAALRAYPRNPWTYPLVVLAIVHGLEHVVILERYLRTGVPDANGIFGEGGLVGLVPLPRMALHNAYNGLETVLMALGLWHEVEARMDKTT